MRTGDTVFKLPDDPGFWIVWPEQAIAGLQDWDQHSIRLYSLVDGFAVSFTTAWDADDGFVVPPASWRAAHYPSMSLSALLNTGCTPHLVVAGAQRYAIRGCFYAKGNGDYVAISAAALQHPGRHYIRHYTAPVRALSLCAHSDAAFFLLPTEGYSRVCDCVSGVLMWSVGE